MRDIAIVGGGPAGCRLAMLLAKNRDVLLIEEHDLIGEPVQCSGLVSPRAICDVTRSSVIYEIKDFILNSPAGYEIKLRAEEYKGVVIDRKKFDQSLAQNATDQGSEILLSSRVLQAEQHEKFVRLTCNSEGKKKRIEVQLVIGADGPKSIIRQNVTKEPFEMLYKGAQLEGALRGNENNIVEMWIGTKIAPGFFAWKIPTMNGIRIGLCTSSDDSPMQLLKRFSSKKFPELQIMSKQSGLIPVGPISKLVNGRFGLLGDAGGQTKPLTGGGLYLGKQGAELLAASISQRGLLPSALKLYEERYREKFGGEISRAWLLRKIINRLSDSKLDKAVQLLSDEQMVRLLEKSGDIDYPSALSSIILRKAPKLLQFAPELLKSMV